MRRYREGICTSAAIGRPVAPKLTRRHLLGAALVVGTARGGGTVRARRLTENGGFTPIDHGYGFRNWSPRDQYFDSPPPPARASIRERIRTGWRDQARDIIGLDTAGLSDRLLDAITEQVRTALIQRAGTNGHCYGMVLSAQRYFEDPSTIPVDRRVASEIEDPTVPIDDPSAPVYEEILERQASQFLGFRAWLGRRAMVRPEWIDSRKLLADVRAVVEAFGTATLSLFNESLYGHQVLAYGFETDGESVRIPIYDPNRTAASYGGDTPEIRFDPDGGTLSMRSYGEYTHVLFNRYDQIERATDRENAGPLDHLTVGRPTVRGSLFPLAYVTVDGDDEALELCIADPDGEELDRVRGTYMDRTRGDVSTVRSLYGADPGTYHVGVYGMGSTDYELTALVADTGGTVVDETRSGTLEAGELHEYTLEVPEEGDGTVDRTNGGWFGSALTGGAGALGGIAAGALGHRTLQQLRDRDGTK